MKRLKEGIQYLVENNKIHHYPYARCPVVYTGQTLYDDFPSGYEKCEKCFKI